VIYDAKFPVTCDRDGCNEEIELDGGYFQGYYCTDEHVRDAGWIVIDGKHYCCAECVQEKPE